MKMPELPEGQRWSVHTEFNTFVIVKLQEKRWWGWGTIASATGLVSGGEYEVMTCVDHIQRREEFAAYRREDEQKKAARRAEIQSGYYY